MELLAQGRQWLKEGEPPAAVLQEVEEQLKVTSDAEAKAAWKLLAAEAHLASGEAEFAVQRASEALVIFKKLSLKEAEVQASIALAEGLKAKDPGAAAEVAQGAAGSCRDAGDTLGEATMLLHQAKALLASMQDPYAATEAAIASCLLYREAGNSGGEAEALEVAARAHLLYDPEQAFKAAKEALAVCSGGGALTALAQIEKTWAAAKAQLHTAQRAEQAKSISCRGQSASTYKWPKVPQIRGPPAVDVFAQQMVQESSSQQLTEKKEATKVDQVGVKFSRKAFKWTFGNHKTDEAWFRQELTYLPPPTE